jgi:hypothetical protein
MGKTGMSQTMTAMNLGLDDFMLSKWIQKPPIFKIQVSEGDGSNKLVNHKGTAGQLAEMHKEFLA